MSSAINPTFFDRLRSRFTGVAPRAYAVRRLARGGLRTLESTRDAMAQRMAESIEMMDRYIDPFERWMDGDRLVAPIGTILDRRSGKNLPLVWTELDIREFRRWARLLCDINPYAIGFLSTLVNYHIRVGFTWHCHLKDHAAADAATAAEDPLVKLVQAALDEWRDKNRWPIHSREAFRRYHRDGEVFLRFFRGDRGELPTFRYVEPEQVGPPPGDDSDGRWSFGILTDPNDVMSVFAYFVRHPLGTGSDGDEVPACRIIHLKANVDSTIKRGLTSFLPVQDSIEHCRKLIRNMGEVATIQSAIAWVSQYAVATAEQVATMIQAGADYTRPKVGDPSGKLMNVVRYEPGTVLHMDSNRQFLAGPGSVNSPAFTAVCQAILRGVGFRFGMPEWVSGDASNNTYNSALIAGAPMTNMIESGQQEWGVLERETAMKVLGLAVESGRLPREALDRVDVRAVPPAVVQANRADENSIYESQNNARVLSRTTWQEKVGLIPAQERANFEREMADITGGDAGGAGENGAKGGADSFGGIFREGGFTGDLTDHLGRKRHYVNGKQVAGDREPSPGPSAKGGGPPAKGGGTDAAAERPDASDVAPGLAAKVRAADPEIVKRPGVLKKLEAAALEVALRVNLWCYRHAGKIDAVGDLLGAVLDTPSDMKRLGYNPDNGAAGAHGVLDPMRVHTGVSTHLACTIASHALAAGVRFAKQKLGRREGEAGDVYELAADLLAEVFRATNESLGLTGCPDASEIAASLRTSAFPGAALRGER